MARELSDEARRALLWRLTEDTAAELLCSPEADVFAKALDMQGWMIVVKPEYQDDGSWRWPMSRPSKNCPAWADNGDGPIDPNQRWALREQLQLQPKPQPELHVVEGEPEPPQPAS